MPPANAPASFADARVSIVVAARNQGKFLEEALRSAISQSIACEILYADDASIDDSLNVARRFESAGVIMLPGDRHQGVCAARNRGAELSRGEYLIFLDGDDRMPRDFAARHLAAMTPGTPFVYGPAKAFGNGPATRAYWSVPEWDEYDRWECNTVNTSAMYARWAVAAAGGWSDRVPTMWDWDLALRAARFGRPRTSRAVLDYRQHADSWSSTIGEKDAERANYLAIVRRRNARLAVGAILSGRLPELLPEWLDSLALSTRRIETTEPPSLTLLDNSRNQDFRQRLERELNRYAETFGTIRVIDHPVTFTWNNEKERRDCVAGFLAAAYARLSSAMSGDVQWFVEDDVIVPLDAGVKLWNSLTAGAHPPHGISGCYRNRHCPGRYIGGWWRGERPEEPTEIPSSQHDLLPVDFVGTGCLMTWPSRTPEWKASHLRGIPAHDWAWSAAVNARRGTLYFHPQVRCTHVINAGRRIPG